MKKRIILLSLTLVLAFSGIVYAAGAIHGKYDGYAIVKVYNVGKELKPDNVPAMNYKGSTLVPIGLLRQLGVDVKWDGAQQRVDISLPSRIVPVLTAPQLEQLSEYVYEIQAPLPDNPAQSRQGSGFLIGSTMITNAHVVGDSKWVQVFVDGKWQRVDSFKFVNTETDLAGFTVTGGKPLPYSTELPERGDPCYSIGFEHGEMKISDGEVLGVTKGPNNETEIAHSAFIDNGGSGGPLLNGNGEVIGINKIEFGDSNMAIPISYLLDKLK